MSKIIICGKEFDFDEPPTDTALQITPFEGEMIIEIEDECCLLIAKGDGNRILIDSATVN